MVVEDSTAPGCDETLLTLNADRCCTVNPLLSPPPPGGYLFQTNLREGGQHNLVRTMVSVPHKELELQSLKVQVQWL